MLQEGEIIMEGGRGFLLVQICLSGTQLSWRAKWLADPLALIVLVAVVRAYGVLVAAQTRRKGGRGGCKH